MFLQYIKYIVLATEDMPSGVTCSQALNLDNISTVSLMRYFEKFLYKKNLYNHFHARYSISDYTPTPLHYPYSGYACYLPLFLENSWLTKNSKLTNVEETTDYVKTASSLITKYQQNVFSESKEVERVLSERVQQIIQRIFEFQCKIQYF